MAIATAKLLADCPALQANRPLWEQLRDSMAKKLSGEDDEGQAGNGVAGGASAEEEEEGENEESQVGTKAFLGGFPCSRVCHQSHVMRAIFDNSRTLERREVKVSFKIYLFIEFQNNFFFVFVERWGVEH